MNAVPWFRGDVAAITADLRHTKQASPDNDGIAYVSAIAMITTIQRAPELSTGAKTRLTQAVLAALADVEAGETA